MAVSPKPENRDARDVFIDRVRAAQQRLAKAVARAGLKDDPYGEVIAAQIDVMDVLVETALLSTPSLSADDIQKLNKAAGENLAQETVYAVRWLAVRSYRRDVAICAGVGVLFAAAMFWGGGAWRPAPDVSGMQCENQRGGRICYLWVSPPTQPEPVAPQSTPPRGRQ